MLLFRVYLKIEWQGLCWWKEYVNVDFVMLTGWKQILILTHWPLEDVTVILNE